MNEAIPGAKIRGESLATYDVCCSRCGARMGANHRGKKRGTTFMCTDCRVADPGLRYLWSKKK